MTEHAPEAAAPAAGRLDDRLFIACGLAWGAGLLDAVVAVGHVRGYALFTAFFALVAVGQVAWGAALYRAPRRSIVLAGALLGAVLAGIWILSRTTGLPIGPLPWKPKPVSPLESVATADELALALVALWSLRPKRSRTGWIRRCFRFAGTSAAVYLILLSSMALMPGSAHSGVKGELVSVPRAGFEFLCHPG